MGSNFVGNILKNRRKTQKLSVEEVVKCLHDFGIDISTKTLYGWENGHRQPDADAFLALCHIYKIDSISGLQNEGQKEPIPAFGDRLNAEQQEIIKLYEGAPPALRVAALAVLKSGEGQGKVLDATSKVE